MGRRIAARFIECLQYPFWRDKSAGPEISCLHPWFLMSNTQVRKPIEIKISTVVAVAAILGDTSMPVLQAAMTEMTGGAADYFDGEFAILDLGSMAPAPATIDWPGLIALFKSHGLNPVAVRNAPPALEAEILAHGLSLDVVAKPRGTPRAVQEPAPAAQQPVARGAMIIDTPVRAGQRVYAHGCDLIVTAAVNNGAELIADGSIHVYAPLRGRALAGASGDSNARIFAMSMEPELVSIAGYYRTFDDGLPKDLTHAPGQVRLLGDRIEIIAMTSALHR